MRIDLEQALGDIAGSAARDADAVAPGPVLSRLGRRRVGHVLVRLATVAAVVGAAVVGVIQLGG